MPSPYEEQLAAIRSRTTYDQRVQFAGRGATPQLASGVVAQSQAYPWIAPQTAYALAANGNQPGDQLSQEVATRSINKKGGGFFHRLGEVVTAPMRVAAHGLVSTLGVAGDIAQPLARVGLTALETPFQVGAGVLRDVAAVGGNIVAGAASGAASGAAGGLLTFTPWGVAGGALGGAVFGGVGGAVAELRGVDVEGEVVNPFAQSTGGLAIQKLVTGDRVDLGSGFLPGGEIHEEQVKNAQRAASINGHALTPGRLLASAVVRPGTTPYNLLSGVVDGITTWELDPVNKVLGPEVSARRATAKVIPGAAVVEAGPVTSLFRRAGILEAADPATALDRARSFLETDGAAQRFIRTAAEKTSAAEIRAASKGKIQASIANQLAAADNEQDVLQILLNGVEAGDLKEVAAVRSGRGILDTVTATRPGARLNQVFERLGGFLPENTVDLLDLDKPGSLKLDNAVDQMDRFLTQARYSPEERLPILDRLMATTTPEEAARVFDDTINGHLRDRLLSLGHSEEAVTRMTRQYKTDVELLKDSAHNELVNNTVARAVHTGDDLVAVNPPNQVSEYLNYTVKLPDAAEVRRLTTPQSTKIGESLSALYNSDAWKSSTHAGDWFMQKFKQSVIVRPALVVRTLAAQHAKMAALGMETRFSDVGSLFRMILNPEFRKAVEEGVLDGDVLTKAEAYQRTMRRISGHITTDEKAAHQVVVGPGHDLFPEAWASRVAEQHADPVARTLAGDGLEATSQSFWDGPLAREREQLAIDLNRPELATSREAADAYLTDTLATVRSLTAENPHVMEAIATGRIPTGDFDNPEFIDLLADGADSFVNPDAVRHMETMALDDTIQVPVEVPAAKDPKVLDPVYGQKVSRMTKWFYSKLIEKPMDFFYDSPALNQLYWREVAQQAHLLDRDGVQQLAARVGSGSKKINIPDETRRLLDRALAHPNAGGGKVMLEHLDELAKARAVDGLQEMTVDMAKRRGWQDAARLMVPFSRDWQQDLTQWARLAVDRPGGVRKAQMTVQGAIGSGFFHKNERGEYVFNYPGSELVSKVLTGSPVPFTGKASGILPMTAGILPGFGPIVTIAASKLLPNKPEFDEIRDFLSPYGDPTGKGVLGAVAPPWAKTLVTALSDPENDRDAANTTMQVARYLVSTGKFSTDTPEEQDRLLKEAGSRARKLLVLQALGKFALPASPSLEAIAKVGPGDGRTVTAKLLYDDLKKMRDEDYETSSERFLEKYGDGALLFLQSATRPVNPGAASTEEQYDFVRANPELATALPNSASFFAPQGGQTFDPAAIARQIHSGDRQTLTPKQQVQLANDQVGSMIYYQIKGALGPRINTAQQAVLSQIKQQLMVAYPGFNTIVPGVAQRVTDTAANVQAAIIPELRKALTIDKAKDSATGQALGQYMELRDAIDEIAQTRGLKPGGFASSAKAADLRAILRQAATQLGQGNAGFSMLFDRLLDRELKIDTEPVPAPAVA